MELREWAISILSATSIDTKLFTPDHLTDHDPGPELLWKLPSRPPGMGFNKASKQDKLPPFHEHHDKGKRAVCLHRFLGHELLAVEMMAYALLAFPKAPAHFRKGLANTLIEEQWHVRLYERRLLELGVKMDDLPFYGHFWKNIPYLITPLQYVSIMHLTLEMANLDFAPHYGASFLRHGDTKSSDLMKQILSDEISHVSFGYHWLKKFKPTDMSDYKAWLSSLNPISHAKQAKGFIYQKDARRQVGLPDEWILNLEKA